MADQRERHCWQLASATMAVTANCHRNPKRRPLEPADYDPYARKAKAGKVPITVLKDVFLGGQGPKEKES